MDKEQIKKALDHFENDEFVDAQDILKKEISVKRDTFIKDKLELKQDLNPTSNDSDSDGGIDGAKDDDQGDE